MTDVHNWALGVFSLSGEDSTDAGGSRFVGLVSGDRVRDLRDAETTLALPVGTLSRSDGARALLAEWKTSFATLSELAADSTSGHWYPTEALVTHAPIDPAQVLQGGANYRKHVVDIAVAHADLAHGRTEQQVRDETAAMMDERKAHGIPYFFLGLPSSITGPNDEVILPSYSQAHDWELELAAVIGEPAYRVTPENALDHVAAYTIVNDLTMRDLVFRRDMPEIGTDFFRSKSAPGFLPAGPWLVPSEFVGDPQNLHITLRLNGQVMQDESTSDMLFTVAELVSAVSQSVVLQPGDLVLTGSPAGNGAHWGRLLRHGDVMESTITGLGTQHTRVVAESEAS